VFVTIERSEIPAHAVRQLFSSHIQWRTTMDRRKFLTQSLLGSAAISTLSSRGVTQEPGGIVTAGDVHDYLRSFGEGWIDPDRTVDTFKVGDPKLVVKGIAVAWMSYFDSLRKAQKLGCNLFITHEPTYYNHTDLDKSLFEFEIAREKRAFLQQSGMALIRCHDVWDRVAEIGIRDAWARFLGLEKEIESAAPTTSNGARPYCGVYEIEPMTSAAFAKMVARKVAPLGQQTVQLVGPRGKQIRTVAVGTGAATPFRHMFHDLKADLAVCSDDGFNFWRDGSMALDMDYPVVIVNHACSEEVGMQRMAEHLPEQFPQVPVHHIAQKCMFKTIAP
jgi:putative NIF3 family GTP cyclohydrolase 1 type 2